MARWVAGTATGRDWARVALGVDLVDGHCACVPLLLKTQASPLSPFPSSLVRPVSPSRAFDALWPSFHVMCGGTQVPRPCFFDRELGKLERGWGGKREGCIADSFHAMDGAPLSVRIFLSAPCPEQRNIAPDSPQDFIGPGWVAPTSITTWSTGESGGEQGARATRTNPV